MAAGRITPDVTFFVETESARLGNAGTGTTNPTRNSAGTVILQDALAEWRLAGDKAILCAGLMIIPLSRGTINSSLSILSFEAPTYSLQANTLSQASAGRDLGLQLKGYLLDGHLEYRAGLFSGQREPASAAGAGSRNPPQYTARLQYDFFDLEKGYTYSGTSRGTKKILALGAWGSAEGDFRSWGADLTADLPTAGKSAATAGAQYYFYDGGRQFDLPRQHAFFSEAGYYFAAPALQPFFRWERLKFSDPAFESREQTRWGGGFNWYVAGQNVKLSALYERIEPRVAAPGGSRKKTNHFAMQLQFFYF
jgi:hypothetical protein